ncbi:hypothetical protein BOX15_Mlig028047g2, partial [Macrostomum lignano]
SAIKSGRTLHTLLTSASSSSIISATSPSFTTSGIVSSCGSGMGNKQSSDGKSNLTPAEFIVDTVKRNPVVVFSKTTCPHCVQVKSLFGQLKVPATVIELDKRQDADKLHPELIKQTGARTVPQVFVCGQRVGGASDTMSLHKAGGLEELIAKCWKPSRCGGSKCDGA